MLNYTFGAKSPSDQNQKPLGFRTEQEATAHANTMNSLLPLYDEPSSTLWNKDYWKTKPEPWEVFPVH